VHDLASHIMNLQLEQAGELTIFCFDHRVSTLFLLQSVLKRMQTSVSAFRFVLNGDS
jgi:hypothetical protein